MSDDTKMTRAEMVAKADELLADAFLSTRSIMTDKTAPATSKASAVSSALAIHRLLVGDGKPGKESSEMTAEELDEELRRLRTRQAEIEGLDEE